MGKKKHEKEQPTQRSMQYKSIYADVSNKISSIMSDIEGNKYSDDPNRLKQNMVELIHLIKFAYFNMWGDMWTVELEDSKRLSDQSREMMHRLTTIIDLIKDDSRFDKFDD